MAMPLALLAASASAFGADQAQLERGAYIARTADCTACHTTDEDKPFAGGLAMPTPMGNIYSTNITPDPETGIGHYSLEAFTRVLREGVTKDGHRLYPAMPYTAYTKMPDEDIQALYAWFQQGVEPVRQENRESDIPWPLSMRWPLAVWNWMFVDTGAYELRTDKSDAWNRGAYLVLGPTHCSTCHTPRGLAMQEKATDDTEKGFLAGADLGGWHAFNITSDENSGIGGWSDDEVFDYLKSGAAHGKGQAAGPMGEAVEHSFRHMSDDDLRAIITYLRDVPAVNDGDETPRYAYDGQGSDASRLRGQDSSDGQHTGEGVTDGAALYLGNCATCHQADGSGSPDGYYPSLVHNSVVGTSHSDNLVQVILNGVDRENNAGEIFMPAFRDQLSDEQVAALAGYVQQQFGNPDADGIDAGHVKEIRDAAE